MRSVEILDMIGNENEWVWRSGGEMGYSKGGVYMAQGKRAIIAGGGTGSFYYGNRVK